MGYLDDNARTGREIFPDLVRAFALIGIALVNVGAIAYPMMDSYHYGNGLATQIDTIASITVNSLFTFKSYTLFSFMFGVGFAYQIGSAQRKATSFGNRYIRRIIGLLVLGLLHVTLFFQGDILVMYAMLGALLYVFKDMSPKTLTIVGVGVYSVQIFILAIAALGIYLGMEYAPDDMAAELAEMDTMTEQSIAAYGNGTFADTIGMRFKEFGHVISLGLFTQGFGVFAFFLFGLAAVKTNIINNCRAPIWRRFRRVFLPIGVIGSTFGACVMAQGTDMMDPPMMAGMALIGLFAPFSTVGYLGLIAKWAAGAAGWFKVFMARGGSATLTAYLMQGLIMSLVFNNYGLGYFTELGAAKSIAIALFTALFTIAFASLWRTRFYRGPTEKLLRGWTYLGKG